MLYRVLLFPLQILGSPEMGGQDELFVDLGRYQPDHKTASAAHAPSKPKPEWLARRAGSLN
jgi:hypothetical protein